MFHSKLIPLEGSLDGWTGPFDVPELLSSLSSEGRTGRLEVLTSDAERRLFFDDGRIVFASSSSPDDRLGAYLLLRNALGLADLRRLSPRVSPGRRLGSLLVEQGILAPEALPDAVLGQVRQIVLDLFRAPRATYRFVPDEPPSDEPITLSIPSARFILDGIESVESWLRVARGLGRLDVKYESFEGQEDALRSLDLDTGSLELLALLRNPRSVEEICGLSELPDIAVCRRLWAFRLLGWVRSDAEDTNALDLDSDIEALGMILKDATRSE